jgi:hypothetical protein
MIMTMMMNKMGIKNMVVNFSMTVFACNVQEALIQCLTLAAI